MILIAGYEGFRVHEIAKVRGEDIYDGDFHVDGKGGVVDWVPLHSLVAEIAADMPAEGYWFPSHVNTGRPITAKSVSKIIGDIAVRAGVRGTAHQLRHFFLTEALKSSGGNLKVAQELGRHGSVATTALYTAVDDEARRAAVNALPMPLYRIAR